MAGTLKPYAEAVEASYVCLDGSTYGDYTKLLDGNIILPTYNDGYFGKNTHFVEIEFSDDFYFWCITNTYLNYNGNLLLLKWNGTEYVDTGKKIFRENGNDWFKNDFVIPSGKYKLIIEDVSLYRIDSEWFFEKTVSPNKYLIYHDSLYKTYNEIDGWVENTNITDIPTEQDYLDYGMGDLSIVYNNLNSLNGPIKLYTYTTSQDNLKFLKNNILNKDKIITSNNINLNDINSISSITLISNVTSESDLKISISPNNGEEWYVFRNNEWILIDNNLDIKINGNTLNEFNLINENLINILSLDDKKFKLKFYMIQSSEIDKLELTLDLRGGWENVENIKFIYMSNNDLKINILSPGTYKINY